MDIVEFFQQSEGRWFSQRTSHHLAFQQLESGKSDIIVNLLAKTDQAVVQLCEQYQLAPSLALCGAQITWNGTMEWDKEKRSYSTLLVPIADPVQPNQGQLLRQSNQKDEKLFVGRYLVGRDEALTLITESDDLYFEERLWFASPNLRLRTHLLKRRDGFSTASFCSEIRMGVTKPPSE